MKRKLLLVGGGYAEIPLILEAKQLGFHVITSGNYKEGLGHKIADEVAFADFSIPEEILKVALNNKIDAICSGCNDFAAISSSYVADKLGLPGHDSLENTFILHHKNLFKKLCTDINISSPKAYSFTDVRETLNYLESALLPQIIKPVDLTGGKGISIINNKDNLKDIIEKAFKISRTKKVVVEDFIEGTNHGFTTFVKGGKIVFYFGDDEYYYLDRYSVAGTWSPGSYSEKTKELLIKDIEKIFSNLKLVDGLFHVQFIDNDNKPYIIEVTRRPPGDLYTRFVEFATGLKYSNIIIRSGNWSRFYYTSK